MIEWRIDENDLSSIELFEAILLLREVPFALGVLARSRGIDGEVELVVELVVQPIRCPVVLRLGLWHVTHVGLHLNFEVLRAWPPSLPSYMKRMAM